MKAYCQYEPGTGLVLVIPHEWGVFVARSERIFEYSDAFGSLDTAGRIMNARRDKWDAYAKIELNNALVKAAIERGEKYNTIIYQAVYPNDTTKKLYIEFTEKASELFAEAERLLYEAGILVSA